MVSGCQSPTSPAEAPREYDRLVGQALAQAQARPDTAFFWFTNTGTDQARSLMLKLGVDYLRYDRGADVLCIWTGEWIRPAQGYATAPASDRIPVDSLATLCNLEGTCAVDSVTTTWSRFQCE